MDLFQAISTLNIVGIVFFIAMLGALAYEIFSFNKEKKSKKNVIKIPQFDPNSKVQVTNATPLPIEETNLKTPIKKPSVVPIIITSIILAVVGVLTLIGFLSVRGKNSQKSSTVTQSSPTPLIVRTLRSDGIKVYDLNWQPLIASELKTLPAGTSLYIGVATILGTDINQARIRVNKDTWNDEDITTQFNPDENVYFIEYQVPQDRTPLRIEAELHSINNGWPSDEAPSI